MIRGALLICLIISWCLVVSVAQARDLSLTVLYDNNPYKAGLETRWGFSCLVRGTQKTILFDVGGEGTVLLRNMRKLRIDPNIVDIVVLSHIHYDHIGGLREFLQRNSNVTVYMPESLPQSVKDIARNAGARLVQVSDSVMICKDVFSTGELGFWIKEESLLIKTSKGTVVITGCAHPGIVNIVKKAKAMLHDDVYLVLGGFHLCWMSGWKIKGIVRGIQKEKGKKGAPCHCSGDLARELFKDVFKDNFILTGAGKTVRIEGALPDLQVLPLPLPKPNTGATRKKTETLGPAR